MRQAQQLRETCDFIDVADHVLVRYVRRGAGYGPESNIEATGVFTVRAGKTFLLEHFWDHAAALKAAGLEEEAASPAPPRKIKRSHMWR